ncbi:MAG TPA: pyruvate kinase [Chloroflexota bacterium]|jgi:pyruvate kinase
MPWRRAKIVVTLGPATDGLEAELVASGLDVARLNFSHGVLAEHRRRCEAIRAAAKQQGRVIAVMQDLPGPKIRTGRLAGGGPVELVAGRTLTITGGDIAGDSSHVSCTYAALVDDVRAGNTLLLDDGHIRLTVVGTAGGEIQTTVEEGGRLGEHKGINAPGVAISASVPTEDDMRDLRFGVSELGVDYVALSFVRTADEVRKVRELVRALRRDTPLVVKLEKEEAIHNLEAILKVADAVMVARGDLGVELAPERVPVLQKTIIRRANALSLPVITATQMLESMTRDETPTRAEAADVANAVWDGTDAVMLSGETAVGLHPLLALRMMDRIMRSAESAQTDARSAPRRRSRNHQGAITHAAQVLAEDLGARAIVALTRTGRTAELLSAERVKSPIHAFSPDQGVCNRLALWWGVDPILHPLAQSQKENVAAMENALCQRGSAARGDVVVITGSQPFKRGVHTNFVKFHRVGGR